MNALSGISPGSIIAQAANLTFRGSALAVGLMGVAHVANIVLKAAKIVGNVPHMDKVTEPMNNFFKTLTGGEELNPLNKTDWKVSARCAVVCLAVSALGLKACQLLIGDMPASLYNQALSQISPFRVANTIGNFGNYVVQV